MTKILLLSYIDYAHSGRRLYEAINRHTSYDISFYDIKRMKTPPEKIQAEINASDIIHLKGDWPQKWYKKNLGVRFKKKPTVQTVAGSGFRRKGFGSAGKASFDFNEYNNVVKTSFEPDLLYDEYQPSHLIPYPIDSLSKKREWIDREVPLLSHIPSHRGKKDSNFIEAVFNKIKKKRRVEIDMPKSDKKMPLSFDECIRRKKQATIYFDQFLVGAYGNSAIEAMQYGIPTACWIAPFTYKRAKGELDECPIISTDKDVGKWVNYLEWLLSDSMHWFSVQTKIWCDSVHSYQAVATKIGNLYNKL
jgi:hypothetical protein